MKRFFKYVSFVAISIALATACEKADESALPNIPLKLSTDEGNTKAVVLTLEKGKTFPEAKQGGKGGNNQGGGKGGNNQGGGKGGNNQGGGKGGNKQSGDKGNNQGGGKGKKDAAPTSITIISGSSDYSIKSLNEAVATVSLKNMSVVIKAIEVGTATVVVTDNYTKQTKEIGVKVTMPKQGGNHSGGKGGKKN